jgi:hypothetical protein
MFDWKILAASFAALLVVSSVLVGGFGFGDVLDTLRDWLGDVPFEGLVSSPLSSSRQASVEFYPDSFELSLEGASFSMGSASFADFSGTLSANLTGDTLELSPADSDFRATLAITETTIEGVSLASLLLEDTEFHVKSNSLETSGQNASLEVSGFSGDVTITGGSVLLDGNFSSVKGNGKSLI